MPWNSQGGGGPWGNGGGNKGGQNPWGKRPSGGNGGGSTPPDLDEMIRKGQERLKKMFPGGGGGAKGIVLIGLAIIGIWLLTGFYRVQPGEQGVDRRLVAGVEGGVAQRGCQVPARPCVVHHPSLPQARP